MAIGIVMNITIHMILFPIALRKIGCENMLRKFATPTKRMLPRPSHSKKASVIVKNAGTTIITTFISNANPINGLTEISSLTFCLMYTSPSIRVEEERQKQYNSTHLSSYLAFA